MASDFQEIENQRRIETDGFLRRLHINYLVNHPLGDNFLLSKEGVRDSQYGFFKSGFAQTGVKKGYDIVSIVFEDLKGDGPHKKYLYHGSTVSLPIERKPKVGDGNPPQGSPKWVPHWNYHVVETKEFKDYVVFATWDEATSLEATNAETYGRWQRSNQAFITSGKGDQKIVIPNGLTASKPGVQSFLVDSTDITEIIYTRNTTEPDTLSTYLAANGKRVVPSNTFGLNSSVDKWLVVDARSKRINDWFEVVRVFRFMPYDWDKDLYVTP